MALVQFHAKLRYRTGKGPARRMRKAGFVPAVIYGKQVDDSHHLLMVEAKALRKLLQQTTNNSLIELVIEGDNKKRCKETVMIRDIQEDFVTTDIQSVDFYSVNFNKPVEVSVPVHCYGDAAGVKAAGLIQHTLREIEVRCLPDRIPDVIEVNVERLQVGDRISVRDIKLDSDIEVLTSADANIVSVVPPVADEGEAELEEEMRIEETVPPETEDN